MKIDELYKKYYLNKQGWIDGTTQFKRMIEAHLTNELEILDIGAGRRSVHNLRGHVGKVVGIDISDGVLDNTNLDEAYQCSVLRMPFEDNRFAVAFADYVFEHLEYPTQAAREIFRVLKPGGVLIIRTPNLWHYTSLISRVTPHRLHILLRKKLQDKFEEDTFKTYYRCNTRHWIKQVFEKAGFTIERLDMVEKEPSYLMRWCWGFMVGLFYERLVNSAKLFEGLRANIFAVFKKF